jgi:hypothetical protein
MDKTFRCAAVGMQSRKRRIRLERDALGWPAG